MKLVVVFLGKRGAGVRFVEIFQSYGTNYINGQIDFVISKRCSKEFPEIAEKSYVVKTFENWRYLALSPLIVINQLYVFFNSFKCQQTKFLFLMPSPSDYFIIRILSLLKCDLFFIIHDLQKHSGEKWPTKRAIGLRLKLAKKIFTLSQHTEKSLDVASRKKNLSIAHPIFPIKLEKSPSNEVEISTEYILCIGRIREYKGIDDLVKAHSLIVDAPLLVIAGEGKIEKTKSAKVQLINRWLKDEEVDFLIAHASFVVFPYRDATQSGLIPTCRLFNKPLIVSDSGALTEQARDSSQLGVFRAGDIWSLRDQIQILMMSSKAEKSPRLVPKTSELTQNSIESSKKFVKQVVDTVFNSSD